MNSDVVVAIISGLCVGIPSIITTIMLNSKNQAVLDTKMEESQKLINFKLSQLTERVDKHNNLVERMAIQERETDSLWEQIKGIREREGMKS